MLFPPHLEYLKDSNLTWFNPCWGYLGFWERIKEFQKEKGVDFSTAWFHRDMKKNKELYVTALAALCMQQDVPEAEGWWFSKPSHDPPDGIIGTPRKDSVTGGNLMNVREVEIVEHLGGSIIETIDRKLNKKLYEPNTVLVCLLSPGKMETFDFQEISKEMSLVRYPIAHVFVVFHGFLVSSGTRNLSDAELMKEMSKIAFIQLLPKYGVVSISPNDCCVEFVRGTESAWLRFMSRGKNPGFKKVTAESAPKLFD